MKLSNLVIYNSKKALYKLKATDLPIKTAYKLNKTIKRIDEKIKDVDSIRNEIIMKYGKKDDKGVFNIPMNDVESVNKFYTDFNEILKIEEEVEFEKFTIDELENAKLTSDEVESIAFLFD